MSLDLLKLLPRIRMSLALSVLIIGIAAIASAPRAEAAQDITEFGGQAIDATGEAAVQAAAVPDSFSSTARFAVGPGGVAAEDPKDVIVDLPPGLVGNPRLAGTCSEPQLELEDPETRKPACPVTSQVGTVGLELGPSYFLQKVQLFNMEPPPGRAAQFGFFFLGVIVHVDATVTGEGEDGYHVRLTFKENSQGWAIKRSTVTMWGNPASPSHDAERGLCFYSPEQDLCPAPPGMKSGSFVRMPSHCAAGAQPMRIRANSWQTQGVFDTASFSAYEDGTPAAVYGCERVPFSPSLQLKTESTSADSPTGLDVELTLPQSQNAAALGSAYLKTAEVEFPEGMSVNPSSAGGQRSCELAEIRLGSDDAPSCPDASKIGSVEVETPVFEEPLQGEVYLAAQRDNPFGSLLALYMVAEGPGVLVKIPGRVSIDPVTGRLTALFDDNPQLPFTSLRMRLKGGERAPLVTPEACGRYATTARMSSWSAADPDAPAAEEIVTSTSYFEVKSGPGGSPCPSGTFDPSLSAGSLDPEAGAHTEFLLRVSREDGTQRLASIAASLPKGLLAKLAGIPYCSDAALGGISAGEGAGAAEVGSPSCPAASQIGSVTAVSGVGSSPLQIETGKVYLAGPYEGAPLSMGIVTPAVAGPFDLGNVVVRTALRIDPATTQVTAVSGPLPRILHGIPLDLRDVRVAIDRPGFILNPTSCRPASVEATIGAQGGATVQRTEPFGVTNCAALGFAPKLALRLSGAPPRRGGYPKLTATLTMPKGGANIGKAVVTMPETEFLENAHIRTVCTRVQYAADQCPKGSVYGYAKAWTPLLDKPLQGPVYLRSSSNTLPDLVASLDGQIHVDLAGRIDSVDARLRSTFWAVPDAPVSKFQLTMQGGRKGLLVNNTNLCATTPRADARFTGQNGKVANGSPKVKVTGCGKKQRK